MENFKRLILRDSKNRSMVLKNKNIALFLCLIVISLAVSAQEELKHLVKSGETLSGIAKQYHSKVADIMRANGMTERSILQIGKTIKIPVAGSKTAAAATTKKETSKPASAKDMDAKIHVVGPKETLYSISKKYGVTVAQLKTWNDLRSDNIQDNQKLIIIPQTKEQAARNIAEPEIKTPEKPAAVAVQQSIPKQAEGKPLATTKTPEKQINTAAQQQTAKQPETKTVVATKPAEKQVTAAVQQQSAKPVENKVPVTNGVTPKQTTNPIQQEATAITETKAAAIAVQKDPVQQTVAGEKKETTSTATKIALPIVSSENTEEEEDANFNVKNIGDEGYFAAQFQKGKNELSGDASTFKTASGWLDKKYYILINSIDAGTIVRISSNRKTVYAKVLGPLPDVKEDYGLLLRMSNAAASVLSAPDTKFTVTINY